MEFMGRPVEEMTREELIRALEWAAKQIEGERANHERTLQWFDTLSKVVQCSK
jgi:hypothetical protein